MKTVSADFAAALVDFAPSMTDGGFGYSESQFRGTVAAYNMLARNRIAYLADEVGMGKTFIALGVMGLLRHLSPEARVVVIAPRENIQHKWIKELSNFVWNNWRVEDNRFKALNGRPVFTPVPFQSIEEYGAATRVNDESDPFLRMTTFSIATKSSDSRRRYRKVLRSLIPWACEGMMGTQKPSAFRDDYGRVLNALMPDIELLIVDEAHNLKHGFGPKVSNRNRVLGLAMGHPDGTSGKCPWYRHRVGRVLLLSATPFEYDYADIYRQLDVLGFASVSVADPHGGDPQPLAILNDPEETAERKKEIISRFLLRRVTHLNIGGRKYSKNMYRREWRKGGLLDHDDPIAMSDTKQRLIVGLIQKKVAEVLGDRRFNNCFQIGMLSSFESFLESMERSRQTQVAGGGESDEEKENRERYFEGDQDATDEERRGIDRHSLATVVDSYRRRFGHGLPHPKLDATVEALADTFETGEKALIFVRRVATAGELVERLNVVFDDWIRAKMRRALPEMHGDIEELFGAYREDRRRRREEHRSSVGADRGIPEDDEGGLDTFFSWFFRGMGPRGVLSGAAFQRNRLASISSVYSTLFEDDYVAWLLGYPEDPLAALAGRLDMEPGRLDTELRRRAYGHFSRRTERKEGYPRLYVYEAYQSAGIRLLKDRCRDLHTRAVTVLDERFTLQGEPPGEPPPGFPGPAGNIGVITFITELVKREELRMKLWPEKNGGDFRGQFRDRELRRELLSGMVRLGASYIDLYLIAIRQLGTFDLNVESRKQQPAVRLATAFLDHLERQADEGGFGAYYELSCAAEAFGVIIGVNFPGVLHARLSRAAQIFGSTLQRQVPAGRMAGVVNKRLVRQFRMPGFPLVLATTDVLQEGEDLHTFCRRVLHYGISWTPSAIEQRTGRVDRIDSLVQRNLDGRETPPADEELMQVHYPHLQDTVEVLQVRRVLRRLYDFLTMIHVPQDRKDRDQSRLDVSEEVIRLADEIPRFEKLLESAFPVDDEWTTGKLSSADVQRPDIDGLEEYLAGLWYGLREKLGMETIPIDSRRRYVGTVGIANGTVVRGDDIPDTDDMRKQSFHVELRSQTVGGATLIRCVSPVGDVDLKDRDMLDMLYRLQFEAGMVKICAVYDARRKKHRVTVEGDRLFDLATTHAEEIEELVVRTVEAADRIEEVILGCDEDAAYIDGGRRADA